MHIIQQQILALTSQQLDEILHNNVVLLIKDDKELVLGKYQESFIFYQLAEDKHNNAEALKQYLLDNFDELLTSYYQQNALSLQYFNTEVLRLAQEYGVTAFIKTPQQQHTLVFAFASGQVEVIDESDYRFKYSLYLALDNHFSDDILANHFNTWVSSKVAYQDYISIYFSTFL
jgi:hypothetical protein